MLAAAGTGFGLLAGVLLGYALTAGDRDDLPDPVLLPVVRDTHRDRVGLIGGVLASLIPARSAARLDIPVRYE